MRLLFFLLLFVTFTCRLSSQISIIGPATPASDWTTDFTLTQDASNVFIWYGTFSLSANELKFRLNYDWATNYGSASWPNGIGILNGPSIVVPLAGTYTITFNQWNQAYSFTLIDAEFVGVGTTSPIEKLDVAGNIRLIGEIKPGGQSGAANQVLTSNGAGSMTWSNASTISATDQIIDADNDTRVTVEDAPDNDLVRIYLAGVPKLELDGNMIKPLNSNLATYLGNGAGSNTTGNGNTFIGNQAGNANNAGAWNTALGTRTLLNSASGDGNVAIGADALRTQNGISNNIGIGTGAGYNATEGGNVFIGGNAANNKSSGNGNTIIGDNSGFNSTTGSSNVFLGASAGYSVTSGNNVLIGASAGRNGSGLTNDNIIIGKSAGYDLAGGDNTILGTGAAFSGSAANGNVVIGKDAGYELVGSDNTIIGKQAGYNNAGNFNVIFGKDAGYSNTSDGNTMIGFQSGYNNNGLNNVFLGRSAGANETGSNKLYIDNSNANKDNALIYGDFNADSLLLNGKTLVKNQLGVKGIGDLTGIELGYNNASKQSDAGKVQYGGFGGSDHVVNIIGGGTDPVGADRKVKIWAEGGSEMTGSLSVTGRIKLGDDNNTPTAGTVRWNDVAQDFEGYDGSQWRSLTKVNTPPWGTNYTLVYENDKLTANDGLPDDWFGCSVSINGDYAIVGAFGDDIGSNVDQGSAYIFFRSGNTWTQQAKLTAADGSTDDNFGYSVSISGDYAIVGAYGDDIGSNMNQGSAYIFVRSDNTWTQQAKLTVADGATDDNFGYSVSISGDYTILGAPNDDSSGSAFVFLRSGSSWIQHSKLIPTDPSPFMWFGGKVSISGDYVVIGAQHNQIGANLNQGSAYLFYRLGTSWTQQAKLIASDGAGDDRFGSSVSISGDYAMIGAYFDDVGDNSNQGSAYIFFRDGTTWTQQAKLTSENGEADDVFGRSVSIYGEFAVGTQFSSCKIFTRSNSTWATQANFFSSDGASSVSINGNYTIFGSISNRNNRGAAYIFNKN